MYNALVTGSNRGIGLGLVRELLKCDKLEHLFATCRDPDHANELKQIEKEHHKVIVLQLDVECDKSIQQCYNEVEKICGESGLALLINNAGIMLEYLTDEQPEHSVVMKQLDCNVISPCIVTQKFLPLLKRAGQSSTGCKVIHISSDLGSCSEPAANKGSQPQGSLAYRMSKAAMNAMTKCMAADLASNGIVLASFHPGWVLTRMGGPEAPTTVEESATDLIRCFEQLKSEQSGGYFDRHFHAMAY